MESPGKSTTSQEVRRKGSEKWKFKNRNENTGKPKKKKAKKHKSNKLSTNDDRMLEDMTEFDEAERLCLPNFNKELFVQATRNKINQNYPEHFNVHEYQKLTTAVERRKYRNSNDLRNNIEKTAKCENMPEHSDSRLCYKLLRGQKCLDPSCVFIHEFRLPRKLRLCNEWKKGFCADGHSCFYLHSEFPCRFHYLGLNYIRHDPKTCRFYHGGPLPKEYEDMLLESIDLKRYPKSREMYENQMIRVKATASNSTNAERKADTVCGYETTDYQDTDKCSTALIEKSLETDVDNKVNDSIDCQQKDQECDQRIQLNATACNSMNAERKAETICGHRSTEQEEIEGLSVTQVEGVIEKSETVVNDEVNDKDECRQKDEECE